MPDPLHNPGAETGDTSGWKLSPLYYTPPYNDGRLTISSTAAISRSGSRAFAITSTDPYNYAFDMRTDQGVDFPTGHDSAPTGRVTPGSTVSFTARFRADSWVGVADVMLWWVQASGALSLDAASVAVSSSGWTEATVTAVVPSGIEHVYVEVDGAPDAVIHTTKTLYVDDMETVGIDWSAVLAPPDTAWQVGSVAW